MTDRLFYPIKKKLIWAAGNTWFAPGNFLLQFSFFFFYLLHFSDAQEDTAKASGIPGTLYSHVFSVNCCHCSRQLLNIGKGLNIRFTIINIIIHSLPNFSS